MHLLIVFALLFGGIPIPQDDESTITLTANDVVKFEKESRLILLTKQGVDKLKNRNVEKCKSVFFEECGITFGILSIYQSFLPRNIPIIYSQYGKVVFGKKYLLYDSLKPVDCL